MSNHLNPVTHPAKASSGPFDKSGFLPHVPLPHRTSSGMIGISDMADLFGVTHRTLHFYEEKGLLSPQRFGSMRVYSSDQLQRMAAINLCREVGMPIAVVQELMASFAETDSQEQADELFLDAMQVRQRELLAQESTLRRQMQQISTLLDSHRQHPSEKGEVRMEDLSEIERQCITLMANGYTLTRISDLMHVSLEEVTDCEKSLIRKLGVKNRFQAIAKAVMAGIIRD
ncbi:MAG: hypothetical protein RIR97_645 [Pseudomonadota bacterium]|jgi:DNA-binding transcriptional MerR regulator